MPPGDTYCTYGVHVPASGYVGRWVRTGYRGNPGHEPYVRGEGPLADAPNLYCTPHSAWYSPESRAEMRRKGAEAALRALAQPAQLAGAALGEVLRNVVNQEALRRHAHARIPTI